MKKTSITPLLLMLVSAFILQGCSATKKHRESGFLSNYDQLQQSQEFDDARVYLDPDFDRAKIAKIKKVYIHPFELWLTPESLSILGSKQVKELTGYFHFELAEALAPNYELVNRMGFNTLGIRGVFNEIQLSEPELSPTDILPFRVVMNAGNLAYLEATNQQDLITQVGIEVEFIHNRPRNVVFAMTSVKTLDTTVSKGVDGNIEAIKLVLDTWIANFVEKLAEVREAEG